MDTTMESTTDTTKNLTRRAHKVRFSAAAPDSEPFVDTESLFPNAIDRGIYNRELSSIHMEFPYSLIRGRTNPYINRPISTQTDYDLYCHCLALRRMCDRQLLVASTAVRSAQQNEAAAKREAAHYKQGLSACEQKLSSCESALALSREQAAAAQRDYATLQARIKRRKSVFAKIVFFSCLSALFVLPIVLSFLPSTTAEPTAHASSSESSSYSEPVTDGPDRPDGFVADYYIGNKTSRKFHRTTCSYLPDEDNRRKFKTRDAAISAGYSPCGHCNP